MGLNIASRSPQAIDEQQMARPRLEVADIFRAYGAARRKAIAGHVGLGQLKVMSADRDLPDLGARGHVELRGLRARTRRLQLLPQPPLPCASGRGGQAAGGWLSARPSCSWLRTISGRVHSTTGGDRRDRAFQNKAAVYDLLLRPAAETLLDDRG